jgi:hypothetical protein
MHRSRPSCIDRGDASTPVRWSSSIVVERANSDGTLDARFGDGGSRDYDFASNRNRPNRRLRFVRALAVDECFALMFGRTFFEDILDRAHS